MRLRSLHWVRFLVSVAIGVSCCGLHCLAGEESDQAKLCSSPDGKIAIRANDEIYGMALDFDFYDVSSGRSLGRIKGSDCLRNVAFVCRWSPKGTHVAVLMFYGTKCSKLLIFERGKDGQMSEIPMAVPVPEKEYAKAKLKPDLGPNHGGASLNGLGMWKGENSVELLCGTWLDRIGWDFREDEDAADLTLMVFFNVKIVEKKAVVGNIRPHALMSNDAMVALAEKKQVITDDDDS